GVITRLIERQSFNLEFILVCAVFIIFAPNTTVDSVVLVLSASVLVASDLYCLSVSVAMLTVTPLQPEVIQISSGLPFAYMEKIVEDGSTEPARKTSSIAPFVGESPPTPLPI